MNNMLKIIAIACCILATQPAFCQTPKKVQTKKAKVRPFNPPMIKKDEEVTEEKLEPLSYYMYELEGKCFERTFEQTDDTIYKNEILFAETIEFNHAYNNTRLIAKTEPIAQPTTRKDFDKKNNKNAVKITIKYIDGKSTVEGNKLYFVPTKPEFKKQIFNIIYKEKNDGFIKLVNTENNKVYLISDCAGVPVDPGF